MKIINLKSKITEEKIKTSPCDGLLAWHFRAAGLPRDLATPNQHCRAQAKLQNKSCLQAGSWASDLLPPSQRGQCPVLPLLRHGLRPWPAGLVGWIWSIIRSQGFRLIACQGTYPECVCRFHL